MAEQRCCIHCPLNSVENDPCQWKYEPTKFRCNHPDNPSGICDGINPESLAERINGKCHKGDTGDGCKYWRRM